MFDTWIDLEFLSEGDEHPLAIIPVRVVGPTGEEPARSIIDTASSVSVFPKPLLERIGIDLFNAHPVQAITGAGTASCWQGDPPWISVICWHHEVLVHAVASETLTNPTLGLNDFFKQLRIDFRPGPEGPQFRIKQPA